MPNESVFLVTVHDPICTDYGDLEAALYGSFLPVPLQVKFPAVETTIIARESLPGAIIAKRGRISINKGRERIKLEVTNHGDRPIQVRDLTKLSCIPSLPWKVGSHYHFTETNGALEFDRVKANGMRLDIPAGTAERFEPESRKTVKLCAIAGNRIITGGNLIVTRMGDELKKGTHIDQGLLLDTFMHKPEPGATEFHEDTTMGREDYISMFGPTFCDRVRLGDTNLWVEIESDTVR